jgi:hypothetical protein
MKILEMLGFGKKKAAETVAKVKKATKKKIKKKSAKKK